MPDKQEERVTKTLKNAVEHSVPDVLDGILSECGRNDRPKEKGKVLPMTNVNKTNRFLAVIAAAAAALLLLAGGLTGYERFLAVDTVVSLDVNPSIELDVNRSERVIKATALNSDAEAIIGGMDLKNTDLEVAVNAIIGSMLKNGYLTDVQNSILVSVANDDGTRAAELQSRIAAEIEGILTAGNITPAVLTQSLPASGKPDALASEYSISSGKAALIERILALDPAKSAESLVKLTVNELNLIISSSSLEIAGVASTGSPSAGAYIGEEAALAAALAHAGLAKADIAWSYIHFDSDDGAIVYDVEFVSGDYEYEYEIDVFSGAVLEFDRERHDGNVSGGSGSNDSAAYIGEDAAIAAALGHAGLDKPSVTGLRAKLDSDDGRMEYDVEFRHAGFEYDYEIDALTGSILKADKEYDDDAAPAAAPAETPCSPAPASTPANATSYIGEDAAIAAALGHAGLDKASVTGLRAKLESDDGRMEYDVDFRHGGYEYDYEIDALTGSVLKADKEYDDDYSGSGSSGSGNTGYIGEDAAIAAALSHAGLDKASVTGLRAKLDVDDGRAEYDVEFRHGGYEYDYEIDALTGSVLHYERELDDDGSNYSGVIDDDDDDDDDDEDDDDDD